MRGTVVYCCPVASLGSEHANYSRRFAATFLEHPPLYDHELVVVSNGGEPDAATRALFAPLHARFIQHDDSGWDVGSFQCAAKQLSCEVVVFFGGNAYFRKRGWLARMMEAYDKHGPNLYGSFALRGNHNSNDHVRSTGFWMPLELFNRYPRAVDTVDKRYHFEHRFTCLTAWVESIGREAIMVTWSGEFRKDKWGHVPNAYGSGDHSDCLIGDKLSDQIQPNNTSAGHKIAIFYHCVLVVGDPPETLPLAMPIVQDQLKALETTGLAAASDHFVIGLNGGEESRSLIQWPAKANVVLHGLQSRNENLTLVEIEKWLPGHDDWYVLYFHAKGASKDGPTPGFNGRWRKCMMWHLVEHWRTCVSGLDSGVESVGCHWMPGLLGGTQNIWAGNFWWAKASFLLTLPSIYLRGRIQASGIGDLESRYESEVWIGNGPRVPIVKDYHPEGFTVCP
jgi:hypothetical protein